MNNWFTCYRKESTEDKNFIKKEKEKSSTIQINRDNVLTLSLFPDRLEVEFVNGSTKQLFFSEWDIKL